MNKRANSKVLLLLLPLFLFLLPLFLRLCSGKPKPLLLVWERVVPADRILPASHRAHPCFAWISFDGDGQRSSHRIVPKIIKLVLRSRAVRGDLAVCAKARAWAAWVV